MTLRMPNIHRPGFILDGEVKVEQLSDPVMLWDRHEALVEEVLEAVVVRPDKEVAPHRYGHQCHTARTRPMSSRS